MKSDNKIKGYCVIPVVILNDENLKAKERLLYGNIYSLCRSCWYCRATNKYLADLINDYSWWKKTHKDTVSKYIASLQKAWYIKCEYVYEWKKIKGRKIYLMGVTDLATWIYYELSEEEVMTRLTTRSTELGGYSSTDHEGIALQIKGNKINNNKINNKKEKEVSLSKEEEKTLANINSNPSKNSKESKESPISLDVANVEEAQQSVQTTSNPLRVNKEKKNCVKRKEIKSLLPVGTTAENISDEQFQELCRKFRTLSEWDRKILQEKLKSVSIKLIEYWNDKSDEFIPWTKIKYWIWKVRLSAPWTQKKVYDGLYTLLIKEKFTLKDLKHCLVVYLSELEKSPDRFRIWWLVAFITQKNWMKLKVTESITDKPKQKYSQFKQDTKNDPYWRAIRIKG